MIEITKEEIREKMFFINDEGLDQPIAVIKVADLMNLDKANMAKMEVSKMKDKIKQAVKEEFVYRASEGRINYSMEEVIYIVNEVIDEVFGERCEVDTSSDSDHSENGDMSQEQLRTLGMQMGVIKVELKYLTKIVNEVSSLLNDQKIQGKEPEF